MDKEYKRWYKSFLGIRQRHTYWLYKVIDEVLNENRQVKGIIEIGTGAGALSVFLGLECYERNLKPLLTYDLKEFVKGDREFKPFTEYKEPRLFKLLKIKFVARDCFNEESIQEIKEYADEPIFIMCDGGNKLKEFKYFAGLAKKDSIIASHDWESISRSKLTEENTAETVKEHYLIPLHKEEWNSPPDYIKTCFWRKQNE